MAHIAYSPTGRDPNTPIACSHSVMRHNITPPIKHHHLNELDGRYYDYDERTMTSRALPRCASDTEAIAIWQGRIRAEVMDI